MNKEILKTILEEHKEWLKNNKKGKRADLSYANLRDANLRGVDLRGVDLRGVDLRGANLSYANLSYADLSYANLRGVNLRGVNLRGVNLDYSCLPLWCGSLKVNMDDRCIKQLLYHVLSIVSYSNNISCELKEKLLTEDNINIANEFHRVEECGFIKKEGDNND